MNNTITVPPYSISSLPNPSTITVTGAYLATSTNGVEWTTSLPSISDVKKLTDRVEALEKKLFILHENKEAMEKFESLKEAYEAYKIVEKLVYGG